MALHLHIGQQKKPSFSWRRYQDVNTVPTSALSNELATVPSGVSTVFTTVDARYIYLQHVHSLSSDVSVFSPELIKQQNKHL